MVQLVYWPLVLLRKWELLKCEIVWTLRFSLAMYVLGFSIAADIVESRLQSALLVGADVIVNCKTQNLKDKGNFLFMNHIDGS